MPVAADDNQYWTALARAYAAVGPPLRPTEGDVALIQSALASALPLYPERPVRVLLLGVTPLIADMHLPPAASLIAADNSLPMIRGVWPGNLPGARAATCANWSAMPLRDASCDAILGDGSLTCVGYPDGLRSLAREARRVLRPAGLLAVRCFLQLDRPERPEDVMADLLRGAIPSFQWLKFRLLMALQLSAAEGVAVDAVYRFWAACQIDEARLAAQTGWDPETIRTIHLYRGSETILTFPTLAETRAVLSEFFEETVAVPPPSGIVGRCPLFTAAPRARKAVGATAC